MSDKSYDHLLDFLLTANRLKSAPRTGWAMHGITGCESVADHSHGVAMICLVLLDLTDEPVDREKALTMAVTHDLVESVTGDLSVGGSRFLPKGAKAQAEETALSGLLADLPVEQRLGQMALEFEEQKTAEARLVRDADRLDLLTQALVYERTTGNRDLDEFWRFAPPESFNLEVSREIVDRLIARRPF